MDEKIINDLKRLKEEIDLAKEDKAKAEGRLQNLMERLETEFSLSSVKEANAEMERLNKEVKKLEEEVNEKYTKLKDTYEW